MAAVQASVQERLRKQEAEEAKAKDTLVKNAAGYLEDFYQVGLPPHVLLRLVQDRLCNVWFPDEYHRWVLYIKQVLSLTKFADKGVWLCTEAQHREGQAITGEQNGGEAGATTSLHNPISFLWPLFDSACCHVHMKGRRRTTV